MLWTIGKIVGQIILKPLFICMSCLVYIYKEENYMVIYVRTLLDFKTSYIL